MRRIHQMKRAGATGMTALVLLLGTGLAHAADSAAERHTRTQGSIHVDDEALEYTTTAGTLLIRGKTGEPAAELSYIAYVRDDSQAQDRPLTFFWDGGPGGATFAENFFGFGPQRHFPSEHQHAGPPYPTQENPYTLLAHSDLVFIDPVGTGYSQALGDHSNKDFWGVETDADAMTAAIIRYLDKNDRWQSPKFIFGSSYGTTRASIVSHKLQYYGIALNGVILIGSALNFGMQDNGMDQQFVLTLPTLAATAWHHGKTSHSDRALSDFLKEVEEFARTEYAPALFLGNRLPAEQKRAMAKKLSGYIGLDPNYIHDAHLRVSVVRFRKALLRDEGITVGRMDGRTEMSDFDTVGEEPEDDYWMVERLLMPARSIIEDFYGRQMDHEHPRGYQLVADGAIQAWNWQHELPPTAGISEREIQERNIFPQNTWVAAHLSAAMRSNRNLRVFQAHGYYDLATPYAWAEYDLSHMTHDPQLMDRITTAYYDTGHVIFFDEDVLPSMFGDLETFYADALTRHSSQNAERKR